jgi:hypothetical protein
MSYNTICKAFSDQELHKALVQPATTVLHVLLGVPMQCLGWKKVQKQRFTAALLGACNR